MPIYEFYCKNCHMIFNFFSASVNVEKRPRCPRCKRLKLERQMSSFSALKNRGGENNTVMPDMDESRMEKAINMLAKESEHLDENDPKQAANLMRKMTDMTGLNMGPGMEEAISRMEAGEDPAQIEADMGDLLEGEEPLSFRGRSSKPIKKHPPKVDDKLYYL
jgi:putative FmdB family regulatory protein